MSFRKIKTLAVKLADLLPDELELRRDKTQERSERWQRSKKGKEYKLDTFLLKQLKEAVDNFNNAIDGVIEEEE